MAARNLTAQLAAQLEQAPSFRQLDARTRAAILGDLGKIRQALSSGAAAQSLSGSDPYALTLETPEDFARRRNQLRQGASTDQPVEGRSQASADVKAPA